jgi:hypothetical protein
LNAQIIVSVPEVLSSQPAMARVEKVSALKQSPSS